MLRLKKQTDAARPDRPLTLADMRAGQCARIACIECELASRCERLLAYGLVQGQTVTLVQRSPVFVVRVDETELAFDADVARCVQVERPQIEATPSRRRTGSGRA